MSRTVRSPVASTGFLVVNALAVLALVGIGIWSAWPIYESSSYLIMCLVAVAVAAAIALVGALRSWSWLTLLLVTIAAYLLLGVPLAVPRSLGSLAEAGSGFVDLVTATLFSWKELVTISIPVGDYQTMLVPAFIIVLGGTTAALSIGWRSKRAYWVAIPAGLALTLFGLVFGSSQVGAQATVVFTSVRGPREFAIGLASVLVSGGLLVWRMHHDRSVALGLAKHTMVVTQRRASGALIRRVSLGVVMVLVAGAVSLTIAPALAGTDRQVLRTTVDPEVRLREYVSPLSQYRSSFEGAALDDALLTATTTQAGDARLRLAVLSYYDGQVYRVIDPATGARDTSTAFARVPSTLSPTAKGASASTRVTVEAYRGVWLPTSGSLVSLDFDGAGSSALGDGFFYNSASSAAVELAPLATGDTYTVSSVVAPTLSLADLGEPSRTAQLVSSKVIPPKLVAWVRSQKVSADGKGLETLVERLRARGYLSHSLTDPSLAGGESWSSGLTGYAFESSLSGHSADRINSLFSSLIDKQNTTTATDDAALVAAVGDDEQFSVAVALLAQYLGFSSRVVLGFDLGGGDAESATACVDGSCSGRNLSAWVEVQAADGAWATTDVSPQFEHAVSPIDDERRDPENFTEVQPQTATEQSPPDAAPSGGDEKSQSDESSTVDWSGLIAVLKIVGVSLLAILVLIAPFVSILVAKSRRRRERLRDPLIEARIVGGWDEYVDTALDHGLSVPGAKTRVELAELYGSPRGIVLADIADRAVFGSVAVLETESTAFWNLVESEKQFFGSGLSRWRRLRAALSLRSFTRYLTIDRLQKKR